MRLNEQCQIHAFLEENNHFCECILRDVRWLHFGTTIEFVVNSIWNARQVRADLDIPKLVTLRFGVVQELTVRNALNPSMCAQPEMLNWGFSEFSMMKVEDSDLARSLAATHGRPFHLFSCVWESERRIDLIFSELQVEWA